MISLQWPPSFGKELVERHGEFGRLSVCVGKSSIEVRLSGDL